MKTKMAKYDVFVLFLGHFLNVVNFLGLYPAPLVIQKSVCSVPPKEVAVEIWHDDCSWQLSGKTMSRPRRAAMQAFVCKRTRMRSYYLPFRLNNETHHNQMNRLTFVLAGGLRQQDG